MEPSYWIVSIVQRSYSVWYMTHWLQNHLWNCDPRVWHWASTESMHGKSNWWPGFKTNMFTTHLCLNSWAPWGQVMVSCSLLSLSIIQFWAQDRQVGTGEHLVRRTYEPQSPHVSYDMLTVLLSYLDEVEALLSWMRSSKLFFPKPKFLRVVRANLLVPSICGHWTWLSLGKESQHYEKVDRLKVRRTKRALRCLKLFREVISKQLM